MERFTDAHGASGDNHDASQPSADRSKRQRHLSPSSFGGMDASAVDMMRTVLEGMDRKNDAVTDLLQEKVAALQLDKGRLGAELAARDAEVERLRAELVAAKVRVF